MGKRSWHDPAVSQLDQAAIEPGRLTRLDAQPYLIGDSVQLALDGNPVALDFVHPWVEIADGVEPIHGRSPSLLQKLCTGEVRM